MKANVRKPRTSRHLALLLTAIVLLALVAGVYLGFAQLRGLWHAPCRLTDPATQVEVNAGKLVKPDVIAEAFGLRVGANLAEIDWSARRAEILARIPSIRDITITRRLPACVRLDVVERAPAVRLNVVGGKRDTGRVADAEGVVFLCRRDTATLPVVREHPARVSAPGTRLAGRPQAALQLIETCGEKEFLDLGVLEVDASKPDFLVATLGGYSRAKIAWEGMDAPDAASAEALRERLRMLLCAVRARVGGATAAVWNATLPGRVFADTKESIP